MYIGKMIRLGVEQFSWRLEGNRFRRANIFKVHPVTCDRLGRFMARTVYFDTTVIWLKEKVMDLNSLYEDVARLW